jgi:hypothetical protein
MKRFFLQTVLMAVIILGVSSCDKEDDGDYQGPSAGEIELTIAAGDSADIIGKINNFREHAGTLLTTAPAASKGRREINWDGVPVNLLNAYPFPADFFNSLDSTTPDGRKRGLIYVPANASLRVSDNNFSDIDPSYATQFNAFSKSKLFSANGTNVTEIRFKVAGTNKDAYVTSFAAVFSDVDNPTATVVEAYTGNALIASVKSPVADKKFSFVGIHSHQPKITRIRITSGNTALAAGVVDSGTTDVVVMDDFIYSDPIVY